MSNEVQVSERLAVSTSSQRTMSLLYLYIYKSHEVCLRGV